MHRALLIALAVVVTACGPVSPELAARQCEERARAATGPTGTIEIGASSDGKARGGFEIGITSDAIRGRDPYEVYDSCVRAKSGQGPIRPLVLEP